MSNISRDIRLRLFVVVKFFATVVVVVVVVIFVAIVVVVAVVVLVSQYQDSCLSHSIPLKT